MTLVLLALLTLVSLACAGLPGAIPAPDPSARPANVLLVVLDDVGRDRVRALGAGEDAPATPTLDKLAREGVRFPNTWSAPLCSPTRASILTGRYPRRTGIGHVVDSWRDEHELLESEVTLPEALKGSAVPWDSSAVGKWHLASTRSGRPETHPQRQGFAWFAGTVGNLRDPYRGTKSKDWGYFRWLEAENGQLREATGYVTTDTADDAIARIGAMQEPWLLYLAFNGAHVPTHVPPAELHANRKLGEGSSEADKYDAALQAVDHELGRVLAAMDPALRARTWVFVVGDNGTPDFAIRPPGDPDRAKGSVYQLGVNVPLIVTGPGIDQRGAESAALVHTADLFATVLDLAGVQPEGWIDGVSFRYALEDPAAPSARRFLFTERLVPNGPPPWDREQAAIRDQRYALVTDRRRNGATTELYDLQQDPQQRKDLLARKRALEPEVQAAYDALLGELDRIRR